MTRKAYNFEMLCISAIIEHSITAEGWDYDWQACNTQTFCVVAVQRFVGAK
jgi:hypothetical protein